ncbi:hypothetical protein ACUN90_27690, partial [Escherichia sp. SP-MK2]
MTSPAGLSIPEGAAILVDPEVEPRNELLVNRLAIIAALPEPAYGPTHGLLSRRSTDRISTSPLANFAQLSMFRFDGVNLA